LTIARARAHYFPTVVRAERVRRKRQPAAPFVLGDVSNFGKQQSSGGVSDAGNRVEQVALLFEVRMIVDVASRATESVAQIRTRY